MKNTNFIQVRDEKKKTFAVTCLQICKKQFAAFISSHLSKLGLCEIFANENNFIDSKIIIILKKKLY